MSEEAFEKLLDAMPRIAEAVNKFSNDQVQERAFESLIVALGLDSTAPTDEVATGRNPQADTPVTLGEEFVAAWVVEGDVSSPNGGKKVKSRKTAVKKTYVVPRDLNFAPDGKKSLEEFVAEKRPRNLDEKNLTACYYLKEFMEIEAVGVGHVLAAYKACGWVASSSPENSLQVTASKNHWLDTKDMKNIVVAWTGSNYIENKMPVESVARK